MSIYSRYKYDRAMDENFRSRARSHYMRSLCVRGSLLFAVFLILRLGATHMLSEQPISAASKPQAIADFVDIASAAGLSASNVFGGKESTTYILESTGTGAAKAISTKSDRKSTRLNSSHVKISYAVFCLKKKKKENKNNNSAKLGYKTNIDDSK